MLIDKSHFSYFNQIFCENQLKWNLVKENKEKTLLIVEAIEKLGTILRGVEGYEFYVFNNQIIINVILKAKEYGFSLDAVDFLGVSDFEEEKSNTLYSLFSSEDTSKIISFIQKEHVEINKISLRQNNSKLTIYKTGLFWINYDVNDLIPLLHCIFE